MALESVWRRGGVQGGCCRKSVNCWRLFVGNLNVYTAYAFPFDDATETGIGIRVHSPGFTLGVYGRMSLSAI